MKCGEIWARSARSSARASRSPCASISRQLDHRRDQRGRLADHARLLQPQPARAGRRARRARRPGGPGPPAARRSPSAAGSRDARSAAAARRARGRRAPRRRGRQRVAGPVVVGAEAVEREQPLAVGERDRARAGEHAQVRRGGGALPALEPAAQVRQQRGGGVHGALHRRARRVLHARRAHEPPARGQRGRERQAQDNSQRDVHPRGRA